MQKFDCRVLFAQIPLPSNFKKFDGIYRQKKNTAWALFLQLALEQKLFSQLALDQKLI